MIRKIFLLILTITPLTQAKNIALCTVATGNYTRFVKEFIQSANKNFLPDHNVSYFIFTDQVLPIEQPNLTVVPWPHKKWPFSTLMRFKAYSGITEQLATMDYVFSCDIDMLFIDKINDEILGNLVGAIHPGYYQRDFPTGSLEKNPKSTAYFIPAKNSKYFAGGFYGGNAKNFILLVNWCNNNIIKDLEQDLIAKWHDETHLNKYFSIYPPTLKLSPRYCYPQEGTTAYPQLKSIAPAIAALSKDHAKMRKSLPDIDDREFVILIPSYNNIKYYQKNLDSVYSQTYSKYRVVYIDDLSPDGTGEAVQEYVSKLGKDPITTIIRNQDRKLALANIYYNIHSQCQDHEIIVMLDGDDQLANPNVLNILNEKYKNNDIWMTYGDCYFINEKVRCHWSQAMKDTEIELNRFREWNGAPTHLRTFYTWLFKKIKLDDLLYEGDFYKMTYDVAILMPMIEMAGFHHMFIDEVLYLYNDNNPISDHRIDQQLQLDLNKYIRTKLVKYHPLAKQKEQIS